MSPSASKAFVASMARCFCVLFVFLASNDLAHSDESAKDEQSVSTNDGVTKTSGTGVTENGPTTSLPEELPDGRTIRPIGLFQSQLAELVPRDYRPISVSRLREAIEKWKMRATADQTSRILASQYWVELHEGRLQSSRSIIELESDRDDVVRRTLGRMNLAIEQTSESESLPDSGSLPRLESESDGTVAAVFRGGDPEASRIRFQWRLNGIGRGSGYQFEMRIPATPQTRIIISAPVDKEMFVLDGVLRELSGPPADASEFEPAREVRWFEIDAGGLTRVRIVATEGQSNSEGPPLIVRGSEIHYDVDPAGVRWIHQLKVQLLADKKIPVLEVQNSEIASVSINSVPAKFTSKRTSESVQQVQIQIPTETKTAAEFIVISIEGQSKWTSPYWLPKTRLVDDHVVYAQAVDEAVLSVSNQLQVVSWDLPNRWEKSPPNVVNNAMVFKASGPPTMGTSGDRASSARQVEGGETVPTWSHLSLVPHQPLRSSETLLRLNVNKGMIRARSRIELFIDTNQLEPVRLLIEKGWTVDSVTFLASGRVVESSSESSQGVTLWPEVDDLTRAADGAALDDAEAEDTQDDSETTLVMVVQGSRTLAPTPNALRLPPSWFARVEDVRGELVAAVVPPTNLNWSGEAAMQRDRIGLEDLSPRATEFFGNLDRKTLYFKPDVDRTPEVTLENPSISFDVNLVSELRRDRDELIEEVEVSVQSAGQSLQVLSVHAGISAGRERFRWSLTGNEDSLPTSLSQSDVTVSESENDEVYQFDVSDLDLQDRRLIGRRNHPVDHSIEIQLPSVPEAVSQRAEVLLGPGLSVLRKHPAIMWVPLPKKEKTLKQSSHFDYRGERQRESDAMASADSAGAVANAIDMLAWKKLRYDAVQQPKISLGLTDTNPNVTIVWNEQVRVIASSRGTDRIEATYHVSPTAPLVIDYDPELKLNSLSRDGLAVEFSTIPTRPIVLQPRGVTERIHVVWNRSQYGSKWIRKCRIPRVRVSGEVLKSQYHLVSSSDTFAPAALLRGEVRRGRATVVEMLPGDNATLIRRNVGLALGWLFSLLLFAMSWWVAKKSPLRVVLAVVVLFAIVLLWWPWKLAVIGWLIVPVIAAAMLATARSWTNRGSELDDRLSDEKIQSDDHDESMDLSWASIVGVLFSMIVVPSSGWTQANVRHPAAEVSEHGVRPANVLVPMDAKGHVAGDVVYIPENVYKSLFRNEKVSELVQPRFQSATYRVKIASPSRGTNLMPATTIEAEYAIQLNGGERGSSDVLFPIQAAQVRRVELIDEVDRILRHRGDQATGNVVATLPQGGLFRIRLTLVPEVQSSESLTQISFDIPPVAASRLSVESDLDISMLRVGGAKGRVLKETDLRRWIDDLGPIRTLQIDYRTSNSVSTVERPSRLLKRRYWVAAGYDRVTIDCEVDAPGEVASGESFQFVIRDADLPEVVSPNWRLVSSELFSSTRRLVTVESRSDKPGPIRLFWSRQYGDGAIADPSSTVANGSKDQLEITVDIPEVIAAALGENERAWFALYCDPSLRFSPPSGENTEPLSVDQFLAAWSGYRGQIDRAFVTLDHFPTLQLNGRDTARSKAIVNHQLHVKPDRLELRYEATIDSSNNADRQYQLIVPKQVTLTQLSVNGKQQPNSIVSIQGNALHFIDRVDGTDPVAVSVTAIMELPKSGRFTPPQIQLFPTAVSSGTYTMTRDREARITEIHPTAGTSTTLPPRSDARNLVNGWVPVSTWSLESDPASHELMKLGGRFQVARRSVRFDSQQLITLARDQNRWTMTTQVRFNSQRVPDFVDVEVPTRWCDGLNVTPAASWSQQPATDQALQVIRIRCDDAVRKQGAFTLKGQLQAVDSGRVGVPNMRVLGAGRRMVHIRVPKRLTNEPIQWRTSAVEAMELPKIWKEFAGSPGDHAFYLAASRSWSIDLAPLPDVDAEAIAITQDNQVLGQNDGVLVVTHWDLLPGGLEAIDVELPRSAICRGAWSAGRAVSFGNIDPSPESPKRNVVRIPLSLQRLPQSVELLIRVPAIAAKKADYIPRLLDVPLTENWLSVFEPSEVDATFGKPAGESLLAREDVQQRAVSLARAAVESIEHAMDIVAERPDEEVATWLQPWVVRYYRIASSAGHDVRLDRSPQDLDHPFGIESQTANQARSASRLLQWTALDARIAPAIKQYFGDGNPLTARSPTIDSAFGVAGFAGFQTKRIVHLSASRRPQGIQPITTNDRGLQKLLMNALVLLLVTGLLMCLRDFAGWVNPIVIHPAFWLLLMGIVSLFVSPLPVSIAMLMVAVILVAFPKHRSTF